MDDSTGKGIPPESNALSPVRTLSHAQPFTDEEAAEFGAEADKHDEI